MWSFLRELWGDWCIIFFGAWMFHVFLIILITGELWAIEDNRAVLGAEIAMSVFIIALGIERLVNDLRSRK